MSWEENKEFTESKPQYEPDPPKPFSLWKKTRWYIVVGVVCFLFGLSCNACRSNEIVKTNRDLVQSNQKLRKELENAAAETVIVTVPVNVTESIKATEKAAPEKKETAPVTDVPETETAVPVTETRAETETKKQISEDDVRALTNPLTKKAAAPYQYTRAADWKDYWIEVKRSDLFGMKPDDFKFFNDYINEKFSIEGSFFVFVTDVPDLCFSFEVTKSDYIRSMGEAFVGIDQKTYNPYHPYLNIGSCAVRFNDANQFEIQGLYKDEYGLEQFDDDKIYYFSEFNDDMFAKLDELQDYAKKLWG